MYVLVHIRLISHYGIDNGRRYTIVTDNGRTLSYDYIIQYTSHHTCESNSNFLLIWRLVK